MTKVNIYTEKGTKKSSGMNLPKQFEEKENLSLLAQAVRVYENRIHANPSQTKRRGDVRASSRKIYSQKGTGRARHGAVSASIFVGGGKAHGPDGNRKTLHLPKKMARKALSVSLSLKAKNNELVIVEGLNTLKKTKEADKLLKKILSSVKKVGNSNIVVALTKDDQDASKYFRNIKGVTVDFFTDLNAYKVLNAGVLIVDKNVFSEKKVRKTNKTK